MAANPAQVLQERMKELKGKDLRDIFSFATRTNTICIDVKDAMPVVRYDDWYGYLKNDLKRGPKEITDVCFHEVKHLLMIKLVSEEVYLQILAQVQEGVLFTAANRKVYGWSIRDELTVVKVKNIASEIGDLVVKKKMEEYGRVINCSRGHMRHWPTVTDGSMTFRMKVHPDRELPAFIIYGDYDDIWKVITKASDKICFKCTGKGHVAAFCRKPSKLPDLNSRSWARVVCPVPEPAAVVPQNIVGDIGFVETEFNLVINMESDPGTPNPPGEDTPSLETLDPVTTPTTPAGGDVVTDPDEQDGELPLETTPTDGMEHRRHSLPLVSPTVGDSRDTLSPPFKRSKPGKNDRSSNGVPTK